MIRGVVDETIQGLYDLADRCESIEDLTGNASELLALANQRSWLYAYWCFRARELGGLVGVKELCRILPVSAKTGELYSRVWEHYHDLKDKYPRLSFTYFATLYTLGYRDGRAVKVLDKVDTGSWSIPKMRRELEKKKPRETCTCPVCGVAHKKGEPHEH